MAARGTSGLGEADVERLREQLAAGRRPRVRVSGPQFAEGTSGVVLAVGDPQVDGEDYVTVRVKSDGVTDELRFAPRELGTGRAPAERTAGSGARSPRAARPTAPAATVSPAPTRAASPRAPGTPTAKKAPTKAKAKVDAGAAARPAPTGTGPAGKTARRRTARLPTVSLTLTSSGATWSVSARRGSRTVTKSAPVQPGIVTAVAALLDLPAVTEAVAAVNEAALREAEARAEALRAELAAVEAELDSHRRP